MKQLLKNLLLISIFFTSEVYANLVISPTQMYLSEKTRQRSTTVVLEAEDITAAKKFEMLAYKWTQNQQGEDVLELDNNILINPKVFVIQPESKQFVRVGFIQPLSKAEMEQEKAWRIVFKELAPIAEQDSLQFLFNISVPLFVGKQDSVKITAEHSYQNNHLMLMIKNNAQSHIQITSVTILDGQKNTVAEAREMKYLLGQHQYSFDMGQVKLGNIANYKLMLETDKNEKPIEITMKE